MNTVRSWRDSIEQTIVDDFGYRADEASKFSSDMLSEDADDIFDQDEPDFSDFED